jgi:SnoaL-like domain
MDHDAADKFEIVQTLNAYMQAIDAADTAMMRGRVFAPDASITLLEPLGVDGYCDFVTAIMQEIRAQHLLMNSLVDVAGDSGSARSYFIGFHRVPAGPNSAACDAIFGPCDAETDVVIGGVYDDSMVRTADGWRIRERRIKLLWDNRGAAGKTLAPDWMR